jgi:DNA repair protein RadC
MHYIPAFRVSLVREGSVKISTKKTIDNPEKAEEVFTSIIKDADREIFMVMMLNTKNKIIGLNTASIGSLNAAIVHPREVLKPAILSNAAGIIVAHNHPSGDPTPSMEDIALTDRLKKACSIMGVNLLDHIIVGDKCLSLRKEGYLDASGEESTLTSAR